MNDNDAFHKIAPTTRVEEAEALQKQSNYKLENQNILKKIKILAATESKFKHQFQ